MRGKSEECEIDRLFLIPGCSSVEAGVCVLKENNKYYMELSTWGGEHKVEITKELFKNCIKEFEGNAKVVKCEHDCQ